MLELAANKGVYTELEKAELTEFLLGQDGVWDVIMSADTLCYFGDLRRVVMAAAGALKAEGVLVFTVERADDGDAPRVSALIPMAATAIPVGTSRK